LTLGVFDHHTRETNDFECFLQYEDGIGIPRDYARRVGIPPHQDEVAFGMMLPGNILKPVQLRDEQIPFVDALEEICLDALHGRTPCEDIRAEAATGKGKTVMALELCRRLQTTTLIIVDQEFLRDQWIERATDLFQVPEEEIGLVQGKVEDWENKSIVIGMIQSLYNRDMPEEFWMYFGMAIFDESHTVGAMQFSQILNDIPAVIRLGVSATSERADELEKVLDYSLGPVRVVLEAQHSASTVRYVKYRGNSYSWYANTSPKTGRYISEVAEDGLRSVLISRILKSMWVDQRHVLGVSDRVEHCEDMAELLVSLGVPRSDIGVITGFRTKFAYAKDDKPKRKPEGYVRGTKYTPIKIQRIRKRTKAAELNEAKDNARVILATYGKFEKGVDVPRLDAGIDMTPRSKAQQLHGRILREGAGKRVPVWVTIRDVKSYRAEHQFASRVTEYVKSNAEVYEWVLGKRPVKVDATQLAAQAHQSARRMKEGKITTKRDGNFTVVMRAIGSVSKRIRGARTGGPTRKARTRSKVGGR